MTDIWLNAGFSGAIPSVDENAGDQDDPQAHAIVLEIATRKRDGQEADRWLMENATGEWEDITEIARHVNPLQDSAGTR